jgi:death-on-curing protein
VNEVEFLDLDDLLSLIRVLRVGPVLEIGLLDAACARPRSTAFGEDAYPALEAKAAALLHSLARNRALADGNKRLAWLATTVFLDLNGRSVGLDDEAAFQLVMDVAVGRADVDTIVRRLTLA